MEKAESRPGHEHANADVGESKDEKLVAIYPRLRAFAAVIADLDQDPDDLVQDVFVRYLTRSPSDIANLDAYLGRSLLNRQRELRRGAARRRAARATMPGVDLSHLPGADDETSEFAVQLLERLSANDRAILYLVDVEGYSTAEVAEWLGLSSVATRARLSRAHKRLRRLLVGKRGTHDTQR